MGDPKLTVACWQDLKDYEHVASLVKDVIRRLHLEVLQEGVPPVGDRALQAGRVCKCVPAPQPVQVLSFC